jgi:hypothetical protein
MSVVDFRDGSGLGPLAHGELDGLLEPLSPAERRDVRDLLDLIARRLAVRGEDIRHFRSRLDAVIASMIGVVDALDSDPDLEPYLAGTPSPFGVDLEDACEDEGGESW